MRRSNVKQLQAMLAAEQKARDLQYRVDVLRMKWEDLRTPEFLNSEEYKNYCKESGVSGFTILATYFVKSLGDLKWRNLARI